MEFIEAPAFTKYISDYLADDEYRRLQNLLANDPELGDLMLWTGGFRKLRWIDSNRGKGRRGGLRIINYYFLADRQVWLMTIYDKGEASDLSPKVKKVFKASIENELQARQSARLAQRQKTRRCRQ